MRMYAKTTDQGTAASETALCELHNNWRNRQILEDAAAPDVIGPWVDATGNDELECVLHDEPVDLRPDGTPE